MKKFNIKNIGKYAMGIAGVVAILLLVGFRFHADLTRAATGPAEIQSTNTQNPYSTTTRTYQTAGTATTTLTMFTDQIDQIDFNFLVKSSSTPAIAKWRYEYSENAVDWFSDDIPLTASATSSTQWTASTFNEYSWSVASSTGGTSNSQNSYKHNKLTWLNSKFTRIVFYLAPGSGAADVWIQARLKAVNPI